MDKCRQVWVSKAGGPEVLEVRETSIPNPGKGEVLIQVEASGINFADIMARRGQYQDAPDLPAVLGLEVAGVVQAVGEGVTSVVPGDPVVAPTRFGGYSSHICVREGFVIKRPSAMSALEGGALLVTYLTAFQAMIVMGGLRTPDELGRAHRVLIVNASGGVGTAAADLGRIYGAELFGAASPGKHAFIKENGYNHAINYRQEGWHQQAMDLTGGKGFDIILDPVGGANWGHSFDLLTSTGRLVMYGVSTIVAPGKKNKTLALVKMLSDIPWRRYSPLSLINKNQGVMGVNLARMWGQFGEARYWIEKLMAYYEEGKVKPQVDRSFSFDEAGKAHAYIEGRQNKGKVLLVP